MIKALTLVVRDKDFLTKPIDGDYMYRLKGTFRDVNEVDRAVYIDPDGNEMYFKNRCPDEHYRALVVEHRIERISFASYGMVESWVDELRQTRKVMLLQQID